jgi:hypothetical protein
VVDRAPEIQASSNSVYHVVDDEVEGPGTGSPDWPDVGTPAQPCRSRRREPRMVPSGLVRVTTDHRATARASTQDVPRAPAAF